MKLKGSFNAHTKKVAYTAYGKAIVDKILIMLTMSAAACNVITVKALHYLLGKIYGKKVWLYK